MPQPHPDPELRAHIAKSGCAAFAAAHGLNPRTADRIFSGSKPCPPRLRAEVLGQQPTAEGAAHV